MGSSHGVLVALAGVMGAILATAWLGVMVQRRGSLKGPIIVIGVSFSICALGYLLTPTGAANLRMLVDRLRSVFLS